MRKAFTYTAILAAAILLMGATITGYTDWVKRTTPGNPAAANLRMYADSTAAKFKCIDSTGAACYYDSGTTLISSQTLGAPAATVTFSSISGTYTNLLLIVSGRTNKAAFNEGVTLALNGDTTQADYYEFYSGGAAAGAFSGTQANNIMGALASANAIASGAGSINAVIPGYAGATFLKTFQSQSVNFTSAALSGIQRVDDFATWNSNAAITSLVVGCQAGGSFLTGSVFTLYGAS